MKKRSEARNTARWLL